MYGGKDLKGNDFYSSGTKIISVFLLYSLTFTSEQIFMTELQVSLHKTTWQNDTNYCNCKRL